jgi:GNAT superfamily N-acetyltransferase
MMKAKLQFRVEELGETDVSEISNLLREVWLDNADEYPTEWRKSRALNPRQIAEEMEEGYCFFGIRMNNRLVGVYKALITDEGLFGEHQSVHPNYRKQGIATAMYEHFINYAKMHNCRKVYVNILLNQTASRRIVENMGFYEKGEPFEQSEGMMVQTYEKQVQPSENKN